MAAAAGGDEVSEAEEAVVASRAESSDPLSSRLEGEGKRPLEAEDSGGETVEPSAEEDEAAGA